LKSSAQKGGFPNHPSVVFIPAIVVGDAHPTWLDRFHLVMDTMDRLPQTGDQGIYLKQQLKDKLIEHKQYINKHGQDMPEIRNWKWTG
jgi:phosphoketolase